ncbi:bacterial Ig-like domain-containing protein, partial [Enterococcus sp. MJM16]|nr:bacterial Ig-like domain-containing protein [Enterococcus sp. MJM16]
MPKLYYVDLSNNLISDLNILESNRGLGYLAAHNNKIQDISKLKEMFNSMENRFTNSMLDLRNQYIQASDMRVKKGSSFTSINPCIDLDGQSMPITSLKIDSIDSETQTIEKSGLYSFNVVYETVNSNGVPLKYSAEVTRNIEVYDDTVDLAKVNVHDSTIYVGDKWQAEDNFDSALDKEGQAVDYSALTVDASQADTTKAS